VIGQTCFRLALWKHEFLKDGRALSWAEAMALFRDAAVGCGSCGVLPLYARLCRVNSCKLSRLNVQGPTFWQRVAGSSPARLTTCRTADDMASGPRS
jgi:hypothetical protein